jgi:hypothetical protein
LVSFDGAQLVGARLIAKTPPAELRERQYTRLTFAEEDLVFAKQCAEHLLKKGWHQHQDLLRQTAYFQQSVYTTALIIAYGRIFTETKGLGGRLDYLAKPYSAAEKALHRHLKDLRHKVYAHTDRTHHAISPTRYRVLDRGKKYTIGFPERRPMLMLTADELKLFLSMAAKVLPEISVRLSRFV